MTTLLSDLRYGLRMLRRNPGFAAVAVITLALGIGANTAIFSVVDGVLLDPLPYTQPERLVALYTRTAEFDQSSISYPNFLDWVRDNRSFSALAAYRADDFSLTGMGEPERVPVDMVSASFFPVLGVKPVIGRTFLPTEDQAGAAPVALISSGFWKRKFGSAPDAVGKALTLNGTAYTIVGVLPSGFTYIGNNFQRGDVYVPIGQWNDPTFRDRRAGMGMDAVGRLKPGVTFQQANEDMNAEASHLAEAYPDADQGTGVTLLPLKQNVVGEVQPFLIVLMAAVGFVLLIACVNVANLLLARSTARGREFAIRAALGASPGRAVRQLLTESVVLALAGGALGLLLASWGLQGALRALPEALPRTEGIHLDGRVMFFTLAASLLAGILFGLAPALKISRPKLHETLKEGGRGSSGARHGAQSVFVVAELALALVLLAGGGLMIRSLASLWAVDPGFEAHNILSFATSLPPLGLPGSIRAAWLRIHDDLSALPGVDAVSITVAARPMQGDSEVPFWLEGQPKPATTNEMKSTLFYIVEPDYLKVMRIPLERGRFLTLQDNQQAPLVTVIDQQFAQLYFGGQNPIGRRINFDIMNTSAEVVGVVGHVKQWGLEEDASSPIQAQCYFPLTQIADRFLPLIGSNLGVMLRSAASPSAQAAAVRQALSRINSQMVMYDIRTMDGIISDRLAARRFAMMLLGVFAALALVMACVGIYGVISYLVGQRTREIGVRMALGAGRREVLGLILREAARMAVLGVAIGLAATLVLTRLMTRLLFGISAHDPLTLVAVAGLLTVVALAACYIPARRATKVDPMVALRYE
ncbi:MAG TPA: ABC transporter permease [Terriglobia bacterium]